MRMGLYYQIRLLIKRLVLLISLYTIARLVFIFANYRFLNPDGINSILIALVEGLRFDVSVIFTINSIFILAHLVPSRVFTRVFFQKTLFFFFVIGNGLAAVFNAIDVGYYPIIFKRSGADILEVIWLGSEVFSTIPAMILDFWAATLLALGSIAALVILYPKMPEPSPTLPPVATEKFFTVKYAFAVATVIAISIIAMRGGLQYKPLNLLSVSGYAGARMNAAILNTPFVMMKTWGKNPLIETKYFDEATALSFYNPLQKPATQSSGMIKKNIVVIILESFSLEYTGMVGSHPSYTPILDSLSRQSMWFSQSFANGKRSIEGIPAIVSGMPVLMENAFITSQYANNQLCSFPSLLATQGYQSSFFHGGAKGTMGFDNFCRAAGFNNYYSKEDYKGPSAAHGKWGVHDEEFLRFSLNKINEQKPPFFNVIFTLSSHHPFDVPIRYAGKFPSGTQPIHKTVGYTDYALGEFLKHAAKQPWYNNTMFVITADHTGPANGARSAEGLNGYAIPLLLFIPDSSLVGENKKIVQQSDVLPTLLDLMHFPNNYISFGQSAFAKADGKIFHFANSTYTLATTDYQLNYDLQNGTALYERAKDKNMSINMASQNAVQARKMEVELKAILQSFNHRMIKNKMCSTVEAQP